jgi:hypothetical protein
LGAGGVLLHAQPANATVTALDLGTQNDAATGSTGLTSASESDTLHISNSANAPALLVRSGGAALVAEGFDDATIVATTLGTGPALRTEVPNTDAVSASIEANQSGQGIGVHAQIENAASASSVVRARTTGVGIAVDATSAHGFGGRFSGGTAQMQLVPSRLATHPVKGAAGTLFVDHSNRLWFCRGGTNWHRLA